VLRTDSELRADRHGPQVAKSSGLNLPSGCTFGVCSTCNVRKVSGEVHMVRNGGITDEDIAEGWILACGSKPLGRVEILA
jgi:ferredoxin